MAALCRDAASVTVLDHHKTAAEEMRGLDTEWGAFVRIDQAHSGAVLAWNHFNPGRPVPRLLQHVQDRDLWTFSLPNTREIMACVFSHPFAFDCWDRLAGEVESDSTNILREGAAIERKHKQELETLLRHDPQFMKLGGYLVPIINLPFTMASDAGNLLCTRKVQGVLPPFSGVYYDRPTRRHFSLRSVGDFDVSVIARGYGGGGHTNAAAFVQPAGWLGD